MLKQASPTQRPILKNPKNKVWARFKYTCESCKRSIDVQLAEGVEGPRPKASYIVPSPFLIPCDLCDGFMIHKEWDKDFIFPEPLQAEKGYMFIPDLENICGQLVKVEKGEG